ncbi:hypothetical protein LGN21_02775 [Burkholderia cepacia]|uniref:hypothetical protein n=1 Tax=Burkholderia cepacia TaxID=292 RepID=UPI001CF5B4F5|nr:hypothetical protein [Burkholderia cepacia]MCA8278508.1 hypothetical protein [Burkholderia cepacia]
MATNFSGAQGFLQNPLLATLPPDQQSNLLQLQQRQAVGQALLAQGLQPADYGGANVGGLAYHVSPLNGISKLVNAYVGNKLSMDAMGQQAQLMNGIYGGLFGQDQQQPVAPTMPPVSGAADTGALTGPAAGMGGSQGNPDPVTIGRAMLANGQNVPMQTVTQPGPWSIPGMSAADSRSMYMLNPDEYAKLRMSYAQPTDATRMAIAAHLDPSAVNNAAVNKTYGVELGPNSTFMRPDGTVFTTPAAAAVGAQNVLGPGGKWITQQVPGGVEAMQNESAARAAGAAGYQLQRVWDQSANNGAGGYVYQNVRNIANAADAGSSAPAGSAAPNLFDIFRQQESSGGKTAPDNPFQIQQATFNRFAQPGESWNNVADRNAVAQRMLTKFNQNYGGDVGRIATAYFSGEGNVAPAGSPTPYLKNVADSNGKTVASYVGDIARRAGGGINSSQPLLQRGAPMAAEAPIGLGAGANAAATNQQGELSKRWSDLVGQNQQAQGVISNLQNIKTLASKAVVGPQSDRLNYVNGLLSLAGSDRATQMVDANALLDKNSNQIIAKLSQGGMGTDAARAILQSAYPNSHMTQGAINEAADNLIGAQQMVQAKARVLAPLRNANDAAGYTNAELTFDQNADPRIFQYTGIKDPTARAAFAKNLIAQDPGIVDKIQALQKLGALK